MKTGLYDKHGKEIKTGDRTRLVLDNGEIREFDVCFKTVKRTTIKTLKGFSPESVDVAITGIFFCWNGNDLLPCVDENGISDTEKMEIIRKRAPGLPRQTVKFVTRQKNGVVVEIGRSSIGKPEVHFADGKIKWYEDKLKGKSGNA